MTWTLVHISNNPCSTGPSVYVIHHFEFPAKLFSVTWSLALWVTASFVCNDMFTLSLWWGDWRFLLTVAPAGQQWCPSCPPAQCAGRWVPPPGLFVLPPPFPWLPALPPNPPAALTARPPAPESASSLPHAGCSPPPAWADRCKTRWGVRLIRSTDPQIWKVSFWDEAAGTHYFVVILCPLQIYSHFMLKTH